MVVVLVVVVVSKYGIGISMLLEELVWVVVVVLRGRQYRTSTSIFTHVTYVVVTG